MRELCLGSNWFNFPGCSLLFTTSTGYSLHVHIYAPCCCACRCGAECCGDQLDTSLLRIGGSCAVYGKPSFGLLDLDWGARAARVRIIRTDGLGTANVDDWQHPASLDFTIDMQLCMDA